MASLPLTLLRPLGHRLTDGSIIFYPFDRNIYKTDRPSLMLSTGISTANCEIEQARWNFWGGTKELDSTRRAITY